MSISYDTMSAYMERETNRLVEEDKAVQKKIADDAIAKVMGTQNQINTNIGNAVETAYRQNDRTAKGLKSETSQIGNQALTERLVRGLNTNKEQINTSLDNLKLGIEANREQNLADIETNYRLPQAERELEIRLAQAEQDKALKEALEALQAQQAQETTPLPDNEWLKYVPDEYKRQDFGGAIEDEQPESDLNEYKDSVLTRPMTFDISNADPYATAEQNRTAKNMSANMRTYSSQTEAVDAIEMALKSGIITEIQANILVNQLGYKTQQYGGSSVR